MPPTQTPEPFRECAERATTALRKARGEDGRSDVRSPLADARDIYDAHAPVREVHERMREAMERIADMAGANDLGVLRTIEVMARAALTLETR